MDTEDVSFADLGVDPKVVRILEAQGIVSPFEVQLASIPDAMAGKDVCCRAPTGSGKTLAFGLPLLAKTTEAHPCRPTSLILTPTRELAEQIYTVLEPLAWELKLYVLAVYGGVSYTKQFRALDRGVDVLVACPGRLLDLIDRGNVSLQDVNCVVLDEADRMADMGFMEPVCKILDMCKSHRQTILFSATLDEEVADLVRDYQTDPVTIEVGPKEVSMESMQHLFWMMPGSKKGPMSAELIRKTGRAIVFCRTRAGVDRVGDELEYDGVSVEILHGGLSQRNRDRAMERFQHGETMALVATDVAARGIDVAGVNCVIHYDPPENGKAYKHRSGRTARGGASGVVVSLVQKPQKRSYARIQHQVGINCNFVTPEFSEIPEFEVEFIAPRAKSYGRQGSNARNDRGGRHNRSGNNRRNDRGGYRGGRDGGRDSGRSGGGGYRGGDRTVYQGRDSGRDSGRGGDRGGYRGGNDGGRAPKQDNQAHAPAAKKSLKEKINNSKSKDSNYRGEARGKTYKPTHSEKKGFLGGRRPMTREQLRNRPEHTRKGGRGGRVASKRNKHAQKDD